MAPASIDNAKVFFPSTGFLASSEISLKYPGYLILYHIYRVTLLCDFCLPGSVWVHIQSISVYGRNIVFFPHHSGAKD